MIPSMLTRWLQENLKRWFQKSPAFFKWWNRISTFFLIVSGLPWLMVQLEDMFGYVTPDVIKAFSSKFVTGCALGAKMMAGLTVDSPVVAQTEEGKPVLVSEDEKLPFTAEKERQRIEKAEADIPVIPDLPPAGETTKE